jgi:HrpA-like RNA helicase
VEKIHATIAARHYFNARICDAARQAYMVIHSCHCQLLDGMEYAHFPQRASVSAYIHVKHAQDEGNFKLKKQVALIATLTKELDSTTKEVEFWQGKYEEATKIIQKMKRHCPQDLETLSDEEIEEFSLHSPPCKLATCAPPAYVIPNDVEGQ